MYLFVTEKTGIGDLRSQVETLLKILTPERLKPLAKEQENTAATHRIDSHPLGTQWTETAADHVSHLGLSGVLCWRRTSTCLYEGSVLAQTSLKR